MKKIAYDLIDGEEYMNVREWTNEIRQKINDESKGRNQKRTNRHILQHFATL